MPSPVSSLSQFSQLSCKLEVLFLFFFFRLETDNRASFTKLIKTHVLFCLFSSNLSVIVLEIKIESWKTLSKCLLWSEFCPFCFTFLNLWLCICFKNNFQHFCIAHNLRSLASAMFLAMEILIVVHPNLAYQILSLSLFKIWFNNSSPVYDLTGIILLLDFYTQHRMKT